ncbi:MAG: hypothetical protein FWC70_04435 [Defluviitaleaceae bacterium]|nr:hypothetical protein [Defluviitaleaceae bacterium]
MRNLKKVLIVLLSLVFASGVFVFGATGYPDGARPNVPPFTPGTPHLNRPLNGGSASERGHFCEFAELTEDAISAARENNVSDVTVVVVNREEIPADCLRHMFRRAYDAGKDAIVQVDSINGSGVVETRMLITPQVASHLYNGSSDSVNVSVSTRGEQVESVVQTAESHFHNNLAVVTLGHNGTFGSTSSGQNFVQVAAMPDLSDLNATNPLRFYIFDARLGAYVLLQTEYRLDDNGFLHFLTPLGGNIIITDMPMSHRQITIHYHDTPGGVHLPLRQLNYNGLVADTVAIRAFASVLQPGANTDDFIHWSTPDWTATVTGRHADSSWLTVEFVPGSPTVNVRRSYTLARDGRGILVAQGASRSALLNDGIPPFNDDGRILLPIHSVSALFGYRVHAHESGRFVTFY